VEVVEETAIGVADGGFAVASTLMYTGPGLGEVHSCHRGCDRETTIQQGAEKWWTSILD